MEDGSLPTAKHWYPSQRCLPASRFLAIAFAILTIISFLPVANAQNQSGSIGEICLSPNDMSNSTAPLRIFELHSWLKRADCIRKGGEPQCMANLEVTIVNLNSLRATEYSAAAGILSLMPIIGALLGSPSNEIWKLMTVVPFGGSLAVALCFGGAILPAKVEDYEDAAYQRNTAIGSIAPLAGRLTSLRGSIHLTERKLSVLVDKIRNRLDRRESTQLPRLSLWASLLTMIFLLFASQSAMATVEQGGVVMFWCEWRWWLHFWYVLVTFAAGFENAIQIPFIKTYKLYISNVRYDLSTSGGEIIDNVNANPQQFYTLEKARLIFHGSKESTRSRNSVMVMISVLGDSGTRQFLRVMARFLSISVYVVCTAVLASVTLLPLKMAAMVLSINLIAGVFGRGMAGWVVRRVSSIEPLIHVIANSPQEAYRLVNEVLSLKPENDNLFQTEINGHIFINGRRVAKRSSLWVTVLGVVAKPFDLGRTQRSRGRVQHSKPAPIELSSPFLGSESTIAPSPGLPKSHAAPVLERMRSDSPGESDLENSNEDDDRGVRESMRSDAGLSLTGEAGSTRDIV